MISKPLFQWIQHTALATSIREGTSTFPWIESIHVLAITCVVGTIAIVDLRLLGVNSKERPVSEVMADVLPFTVGAFVVALITGSLLFMSHAWDYMNKAPFVAKLCLLVVAGINLAYFHLVTQRDIRTWDSKHPTPLSVKLAGGISLSLWIAVVACGRWTGFV